MMEWHPVIKAGRSRIRVTFEGGHFSGSGQTPATFETWDPVVQRVLESSEHFKSGRIRLAHGFKKENQVNKNQSAYQKNSGEMVFDTLSNAREYLIANKKIKRSLLMSQEDCIEEAAKAGLRITIRS